MSLFCYVEYTFVHFFNCFAGWFTFIFLFKERGCYCYMYVPLSHGDKGWSADRDCGFSWSYSLSF